MGSVEDQQERVSHDTLVRHPKDPLPLWRNSPELLRRYEDIILSLAPAPPVLPDNPSALAHPIVWRPP
jgi:hypothetical protein